MSRLATCFILGALSFIGPALGSCATAQSAIPPAYSAQDIGEILTANGYTAIALQRIPSGLDIVTLQINGVEGRFLLDTGASNSVINSRALSRFKISSGDILNSDSAIGFGGEIAISSYKISGLTINGRNFPLPQISATDLTPAISALASTSGIRLDGVIGQDVMIRFDGVIDTKNRTLFLRRPQG